jgi:predicted Zn finger-like uncharacterized protein
VARLSRQKTPTGIRNQESRIVKWIPLEARADIIDNADEEDGVIITCTECQTKYRYDEARFGGAKKKRVKCTSCGHTFSVDNPAVDMADATNVDANKADDKVTSTDKMHLEPEAPELPQLAPLPRDMRFSLAVIAGAQAGSVFQITKPRVFLGRGSAMDIQLKDSEVSRRHSMLEFRGDQATLIDLGATNGTFVAGERISKADLTNRSEFTLGSTTLMLIVTHTRETP